MIAVIITGPSLAVLSILSKLSEKHVAASLRDYHRKSGLFCDLQLAFSEI